MINKEFNLNKFKKQSAKVSGFLSEKGHVIPKSTILHALSIFLEEKNWNTLSAKLEEPKINEVVVQNTNTEMQMSDTLHEDCFLILKHIYFKIFAKHFPMKSKSFMYENLKNIVSTILYSNDISPPSSRTFPSSLQTDIFPDAQFLIEDMNLIGDEQILKIAFSCNKKINNSFLINPSFNLFDFLRSSIYLMTKPDAITGCELGKNILGTTTHVCLESAHRSKAYFFIPLSMKNDFVELLNTNISYGFSTSMNQKHLDTGYVNIEENLAEKLLLLGVEDIQFTSCFLNDPNINDFLKTR